MTAATTRPTALRSRAAYTRTDVRLSRALTELAGRARIPLAALSLGLGVLAGCGDPDPAAAPMAAAPAGSGTQVGRVPLEPTCIEGAVEPCHEMLGEHDGIVSCYEGTRSCAGGVFGACIGGETYDVVRGDAPSGGASLSLRPLALSSATECTNNPCNRYCREFNEAPPLGGLAPDVDATAPPLSSWITGNASDYPPEWVVVGNREPCQVAGDCQFNTECTDPSLGSCTHSVCGVGEPLAAGCNRCADTVCALNADCCGTAPTCNHDPCETGSGAPLDRTCDTCVDAVCDVHPECCDATWNEACVGYVATLCEPLGQSCTCPEDSVAADGTCYVAGGEARDYYLARDACATFGTGWSLLEVSTEAENDIARGLVGAGSIGDAWVGGIETSTDQWNWHSSGDLFFVNDPSGGALQGSYTYENWASAEPELGTPGGYGITVGSDGQWRDAALGLEFGYLCEGPKNRLGPKLSPYGWGPECVELAGRACGVSCSESLPLGIGACSPRVPTDLDATCTSFDLALGATCEAGGVPQVPVCNHGQLEAPAGLRLTHLPIAQIGNPVPDFTDAGDCALTEAIPPGRCVTVTDCPGLTADRALVVNPGALDASECRSDDNWTIYQPLSCRPATCEANVYDAGQVEAHNCSIDIENPLGIDPALARVTVGTNVPEPTCGANEIRWGASCYFFSTDIDTWDDAQDRCRARGAGWDLVALNSEAENAWVRTQTDPAQDIQIGLNDKDVEGGHVWSNGSCFGFDGWDSPTGQPNNTPPGSEQCVRMTATSASAWEDKACNDGEHPFACEGPVLDARGGCASGQLAGPDGNCYAFERGSRSFVAAQASCLAMGPGWGLVAIDDETTNDFVTSLIDCTSTWLNNPPGAYSHWKAGESVDLSNAPFIDPLGEWHAYASPDPRATLCQGPATSTGAPVLDQVAGVGACTGADEFYFTGSALAPEALQLCPATCDAAAAVAGRRIEVEIPCAPPQPPAIVTEHTHVYEPTCSSSTPQWDFLYYDAVTPADSRIEFEVRSALSTDDLTANTTAFIEVAEAHAVPTDTQRCEVGPTGSGCPIDLYNALAGAGQNQQVPVLELRVRLIPGSSGEGPVLRDWKIRFSCPPAQ
jgi:hypothetical protein